MFEPLAKTVFFFRQLKIVKLLVLRYFILPYCFTCIDFCTILLCNLSTPRFISTSLTLTSGTATFQELCVFCNRAILFYPFTVSIFELMKLCLKSVCVSHLEARCR